MVAEYFAEFGQQVARKTLAAATLIQRQQGYAPRKILVVGCGDGSEAGEFARFFQAETTGIDVDPEMFDHGKAAPATLVHMDAENMQFPDASFDMIYSFHALEHIPHPDAALREMSRVLRDGGSYFIGTPNKSRIVGYIGAGVPLDKKVEWNIADWKMRLRGKWSNESGAHAGFTATQLQAMCRSNFGQGTSVEGDYYRLQYGSREKAVNAVIRSGLKDLVFPCVYVFGTKQVH